MRSSTGMRNAFGSVLALILFCAMALSGCETRERTDLTASVLETVTSDAGTAQQTEAADPANAAPASRQGASAGLAAAATSRSPQTSTGWSS